MKTVLEVIGELKPRVYLEIGILNCEVLFNVDCELRVGVDIDPMPISRVNPAIFWQVMDWRMREDFIKGQRTMVHFCSSADYLKRPFIKGFDVILIDGDHEFRAALGDIEGSMNLLNEGGYILVHDTNPVSEGASLIREKFEEYQRTHEVKVEADTFWNGDVWKAILELRERGLSYKTADVLHGLTIIPKQEIKGLRSEDRMKEIDGLDYGYFDKNRVEILNLR